MTLIDLLMLLVVAVEIISIPLGYFYGWRTFLLTAASPFLALLLLLVVGLFLALAQRISRIHWRHRRSISANFLDRSDDYSRLHPDLLHVRGHCSADWSFAGSFEFFASHMWCGGNSPSNRSTERWFDVRVLTSNYRLAHHKAIKTRWSAMSLIR